RGGRAPSGFEINVEPGLLIEAQFLRVEIWRVIAACDPVEREGYFLRRRSRRGQCNSAECGEREIDSGFHAGLRFCFVRETIGGLVGWVELFRETQHSSAKRWVSQARPNLHPTTPYTPLNQL